eukprot:TRINITY_DN2957_c2_g1_i1.p1 TRINITY_DN2957_c2_g1~~TRINITY_DN2957_c2_g1_i1.p1  ORF type:complete len:414 (+),score=141.26 TRINITY_DN2957_c2_g1_i1:60-1301(+)
MSTIRFEDLGRPIQQLLTSLKDGYSEAHMALMKYVSVKDMAKIYDDLNSKKAEEIFETLLTKLKKRRQNELEERRNAAAEKNQNQEEVDTIEAELRELEREEEAAKAAKEERKRMKKEKKEKRERDRKEREEQAERELAEAEAAAKALDEEAAEKALRKAQKKIAKKKREEERLALEAAEAEEAEAKAIEEEVKSKEERKKQKKKEVAKLKAKEEDLRLSAEQALKEEEQTRKATLAEQWDKFVKDHPLEYGGAEDEIAQVAIERKTKAPPKEFLQVKQIRVPSVEEKEEAAFFKLDIRTHGGKQSFVERRYNAFVDLKNKLGSTLDVLDATFPGKTFTRLKGPGLDKRRLDLEIWINDVIQKLGSTRSYAGITLDAKQQLRGDAARAEAERQRMQQAGIAKQALHAFCELTD